MPRSFDAVPRALVGKGASGYQVHSRSGWPLEAREMATSGWRPEMDGDVVGRQSTSFVASHAPSHAKFRSRLHSSTVSHVDQIKSNQIKPKPCVSEYTIFIKDTLPVTDCWTDNLAKGKKKDSLKKASHPSRFVPMSLFPSFRRRRLSLHRVPP